MSCAGLSPETLSEKSGVPVSSILDAVDYRPELGASECRSMAAVLGLNEVGLCALASGKYPLPEPEGLPFNVWPVRMKHGIGVVSAYIVSEADSDRGLLFDTGPDDSALELAWPKPIRGIDAIFVTARHGGRGKRPLRLARGLGLQDAGTLRHAQLLPCPVRRRPVGPLAPRVRGSSFRRIGRRTLPLPEAASGAPSPGPGGCPLGHGRRPGTRPDDDCRKRAALQSVCRLGRPPPRACRSRLPPRSSCPDRLGSPRA
jgi:hypothetical protein